MGKSLLALTLTATLCAGLLGGCMSADKQVVNSSPSRPTTVTLIDSISRQPMWNLDIPVDHKVICDFDTDFMMTEFQNPGEYKTTKMTWKLYPADAWSPYAQWPLSGSVDSGVVEIDNPVRLVVSYRPPESSGAIVKDLPAADTAIHNKSGDPAPTIDQIEQEAVAEADAQNKADAEAAAKAQTDAADEAFEEATEPAQDEGM